MTAEGELEGRVARAVLRGAGEAREAGEALEPRERGEAVEALVGALLTALAGWPARATDGFVPLREEASESGYFAAGKMFLIEDQRSVPAVVELRFDAEGRVVAGAVKVEVEPAGRGRVEARLFAHPHEMAEALPWVHRFERGAGGWGPVGLP